MLIELTKPNLVYVLFRHVRLIIGITLAVFVLTALYCLFSTPQYHASAGMVVNFSPVAPSTPGLSAPTMNPTETPMDHEEIISSYILELQSVELIRKIVETLGADKIYPPHLSLNPMTYIVDAITAISNQAMTDDEEREQKIEDTVDRLIKKDLEVKGERNANVISVSVRNPDRRIATDIARMLVDSFLEQQARIGHGPRLDFVRQQVAIYKKQVADTQAAMERFQIDNGISSMAEERTVLIQERANLEQSLLAAQSRADESVRRLAALDAKLRATSRLVVSPQAERDPLELTARSNLADLMAREARLEQTFAADSPAVIDIRREVAAARATLTSGGGAGPLNHADPNYAYGQLEVAVAEAKADADAAQASVATQRQQLATLDRRLAERDREEGGYQDVVREYQLADQNYRTYLQGVQEARVAEDLIRDKISSIAVYDAAFVPAKPERPGLLVMSLGLVGGFLLSILAAFITEAMEDRFNTPRQIVDMLGIPVLGYSARLGNE